MSERQYKPQGYSTVSPYLLVDGADETIRFLTRVFGATELRRFATESGRIAHAEVRIGDSVIMLADSTPDWPGRDSYVHLYVPDVDATYAQAIEEGAVSVQEPMKKDDPDRRAGVKDVGGTTWWIATLID